MSYLPTIAHQRTSFPPFGTGNLMQCEDKLSDVFGRRPSFTRECFDGALAHDVCCLDLPLNHDRQEGGDKLPARSLGAADCG